jgi:hypothetical protein
MANTTNLDLVQIATANRSAPFYIERVADDVVLNGNITKIDSFAGTMLAVSASLSSTINTTVSDMNGVLLTVSASLVATKIVADDALPAVNLKKVYMTSATEGSDAIRVTGQVMTLDDLNAAGNMNVLLETYAVSSGSGSMTIVSGSEYMNTGVVATSKENKCVVQTTDSGSFVVSVADTRAEAVFLKATVDGCIVQLKTLLFA